MRNLTRIALIAVLSWVLGWSTAFALDIKTTDGPGGWQRDGSIIRVQNPDTDTVILDNLSGLTTSSISDFEEGVLGLGLSWGIDSHEIGDDESCKVTFSSWTSNLVNIAPCEAHWNGREIGPFNNLTGIDPDFGVGQNSAHFGIYSSGLIKQESHFTVAQRVSIIPIARIQAKGNCTGPGCPISDVGILNERYLISEDSRRNSAYLENVLGSVITVGGVITENAVNDLQLDISAGDMWTPEREEQTWPSFTNLSGLHTFHNSSSLVVVPDVTFVMDNVNYDDGNNLVPMQNNNFHCSHSLFMSSRGTQDTEFDRLRFIWVHCASEWNNLQDAIDSGIDFGPFIDQATSGLVPLAQVIVKKNSPNIILIENIRQGTGTVSAGTTTTLQGAYNNSSPGSAEIVLNAAQDGFTISDNSAPIGGELSRVTNFTNTTTYWNTDDGQTDMYGVSVAYNNVSSTSVPVEKSNFAFDCDASGGSVTFDMYSTFPSDKQPVYEFTVTDATNKCYIDGNGAQTVTVNGAAFATYSGLDVIGESIRLQGTGTGYVARGANLGFVPHFEVRKSADQTGVVTATDTLVTWGIKDKDAGGYFDLATESYTPPAGFYCFDAQLRINSNVDQMASSVRYYVNGSIIFLRDERVSGSGIQTAVNSTCTQLDGDDIVTVYYNHNLGSDNTIDSQQLYTRWVGYRVGD